MYLLGESRTHYKMRAAEGFTYDKRGIKNYCIPLSRKFKMYR